MINTSGSVNPWSSNDTLLGIQLGDPQSGLVLARRHGLLPHHGLEDSDLCGHVGLSVCANAFIKVYLPPTYGHVCKINFCSLPPKQSCLSNPACYTVE